MDNNKSHQVDEIKQIWSSQSPIFIKDCKFGVLLKKELSLKDNIFAILSIYLEGKLFKIDDIIDDELTC